MQHVNWTVTSLKIILSSLTCHLWQNHLEILRLTCRAASSWPSCYSSVNVTEIWSLALVEIENTKELLTGTYLILSSTIPYSICGGVWSDAEKLNTVKRIIHTAAANATCWLNMSNTQITTVHYIYHELHRPDPKTGQLVLLGQCDSRNWREISW